MATLKDLKKLAEQRQAIDETIRVMERELKQEAMTRAATVLAEAGLSLEDLITHYKRSAGQRRVTAGTAPKTKSKAAPKFRDKQTGETWSGRGLQPRWLKAALKAGKKLEDFRI